MFENKFSEWLLPKYLQFNSGTIFLMGHKTEIPHILYTIVSPFLCEMTETTINNHTNQQQKCCLLFFLTELTCNSVTLWWTETICLSNKHITIQSFIYTQKHKWNAKWQYGYSKNIKKCVSWINLMSFGWESFGKTCYAIIFIFTLINPLDQSNTEKY